MLELFSEKQFEKTVEDINATNLFCNATGEILNKMKTQILTVISN